MIYFVQAEDGAVKIGYSTDDAIHARLDALRVSSSQKLTCLGVIEGDQGDEHRLHAQFQRSRIRGEWFKPMARLMTYIRVNAEPLPPRPKNRRPGRVASPWRNKHKGNAWFVQLGRRKIRLADADATFEDAQAELDAVLAIHRTARPRLRHAVISEAGPGYNLVIYAMGI